MSKSKLYVWLLSILGIQLQSCFPFSAIEYGCQFTTFKTNGTVQDESGQTIQNAQINVKVNVYDKNSNIALTRRQNVTSDKDGKYEVKHGECDLDITIGKIDYELITISPDDLYDNDTTHIEIGKEDIKIKKESDDDIIINQEIDVTLKKRQRL